MNWKKVSNYCIQAEGYYIAKNIVMRREKFTVYRNKELLGIFKTAKAAKEFCNGSLF